jgi:hypothetical protein
MATTTTALQFRPGALASGLDTTRLPAVHWRDPHSVPPEKLGELIVSLEKACAQNPANADLRTCLGMAHAMNYDVYRSMDALEEARGIEPENFFAQLKYGELFFRLRVMDRAEEETLRALELAGAGWELALARRQLSEIRRLNQKGLARPRWTKSLYVSTLGFGLITTVVMILYAVFR